MTNAQLAKVIAERTNDAWSFDRYRSWVACAKVLLDLGFDDPQTEAILRSKVTRWAADASDRRYGHATSGDLERYVRKARDSWLTDAELSDWVLHTVGAHKEEGASDAGSA